MLSYLLAVAAACANAAANVLQRKANRKEPPDLAMSPRLIADLVRRRAWLGGFVAVLASFVLMAAALSLGRLSAVQPIVVMELPLTLVGAAKMFGTRLGRRDWGAALAMAVGLAGIIGFLAPAAGNQGRISGITWLVASGATVAIIAVAVTVGLVGTEARGGARRPAALGTAAGMSFGLTAAFMKGMTAAASHGVVEVLATWQTYALAVSGLAGMYLMQNALHAGLLLVAQPGITLADPAVAIVWGVAVFHERTQGGTDLVLAAAAGALMAAATVVLARSPLLRDNAAPGAEETSAEQHGVGREAPAGAP